MINSNLPPGTFLLLPALTELYPVVSPFAVRKTQKPEVVFIVNEPKTSQVSSFVAVQVFESAGSNADKPGHRIPTYWIHLSHNYRVLSPLEAIAFISTA